MAPRSGPAWMLEDAMGGIGDGTTAAPIIGGLRPGRPGDTPVNWTRPALCDDDGPRAVCRPLGREGINDRHARSDKVIDIARDESKSVHLDSCGQQAIDEGHGNAQHRPRICNRPVDGKHAVAEAPSHLPEPPVQRPSLLRVTSPLQLDAATYLCQNDDAC